MHDKRTLTLAILAIATSCCCCAPHPPGFEKFNPPPGPAREALVAVLEAWHKGTSPDAGVGEAGDVHVVDKQRKPGQRLVGYEILGEVNVEKGRGFAVRLSLQDPEESSVVRFLVIGERPLWVWRQEDFEMISHWMHPMDDVQDPGKDRPATPPKAP